MAEERRRRRRGRRRGRGGEQPPGRPPEERPEEEQPEVAEESEAPGVLPSRLRFRFGRRGGREEEKARERRDRGREERPAAAAPADVSPLSFWRRGRTRTYREQPTPRRTLGRTWRRIRGMHFPPWVPVVFIVAVVFGILAIMFIRPWGGGGPRINDYWRATYQVIICGEPQPNVPGWEGGVNTYGDGIIHIRPSTAYEEGAGARLVKWFEYGGDRLGTGARLTKTELQLPGQRDIWKNGDECPDGTEGMLQVFANDEQMDDWSRYIPQDGDQVRIVFGPEEEPEATEEAGEAEPTGEPEATEEAQDEAEEAAD